MAKRPTWTKEPPTEDGWYWHWNGSIDDAPFPLSVLGQGGMTGKLFVTMGNTGFNRPIDCEEYGGWWMRIVEPPIPQHLWDGVTCSY